MAQILIVDDDPKVARSLELALRAAGHEVCKAEGPDQALAHMAECKPDLMVVDVMMPTGTEGFHLVWAIRQLADEALKNVPIIMATGIHEHTEMRFYPENTDGTYQPGEFLPIQAWIDKPVRVEDLHEKVAQLLAAKQ